MTPSKSQVGELVEELERGAVDGALWRKDGSELSPDAVDDRLRQAATALRAQEERIAALEGEVERVKGERDEAREIAKRVPSLEFDLKAKTIECEIAGDVLERARPHSTGHEGVRSGDAAYYQWRNASPDVRRSTPEAQHGFRAGWEAAEARAERAEAALSGGGNSSSQGAALDASRATREDGGP